eukprot:53345-Eustigmatos_ZCMA.PRE.1
MLNYITKSTSKDVYHAPEDKKKLHRLFLLQWADKDTTTVFGLAKKVMIYRTESYELDLYGEDYEDVIYDEEVMPSTGEFYEFCESHGNYKHT